MKTIQCSLKGIVLERAHNAFRLAVDELAFATTGDLGVNKLPLIGKSGAGKSTLLNIMAAIEWPQHGSVSWTFPDSETISWSSTGPSGSDARVLRRKYFGFAFQDSTLISHLCVRDNLVYPLFFQGMSLKEAHKKVWHVLDRVLLEEEKSQKESLLRQFPSRLSGGQRQRVALVQAMIHEPKVLFADEPTGSLDRETRKQVMQVLYNWVDDPQYQGQRLLLWVTHHENDPRDAGVEWLFQVKSGQCKRVVYKSKRKKKPGQKQRQADDEQHLPSRNA